MVQAERERLDARLAQLGDVDLASLPLVEDARMRAAISMLTALGPPTYLGRPALFPVVVLKAVNLSLEHGNCEASCFAYSLYSMLLVSAFDDIDAGFRFSDMCIRLNERLEDAKLKGTVLHIHGSHIHCWRHAYRDGFGFLERGFAACVAAGDVTMANYNGFQASWQYVFGSRRLADAAPVLDKYLAFARVSRHESAWWTIRAQQRVMQALQGTSDLTLDGDGFDTAQALAALHSAGFASGIAFIHIARVALAVIAGEFERARAAATDARAAIDAVQSLPIEADFVYYEALALAAETPADMERIGAAEMRLAAWASHAPANFAHKHLLVRAERARLAGDTLAAMREYERAMSAARDNGALQDAALACETAARFYFAAGVDRSGVVGLRQAATWYREWGAHAKRVQLERRLMPALHEAGAALPALEHDPIDLRSVMKAAEAISRETDRERLLRALMHNVMQLAGAQFGWLLQGGHDALAVAVSAEVAGDHIGVRLGAPRVPPPLPASVLAFVQRTRESVVLHDAVKRGRFSNDGALTARRVRSLMCLPVQQASGSSGLLYLENNLAAGAFTPERVLTLEVLAGQIAIALDNARLVAELKDSALRSGLAATAARLLLWTLDADLEVHWGEGADHAPLDQALAVLHPEDRSRVRQQLLAAMQQGGELDIEYRYVRPHDAAIRTMSARGRASRDADGRPLRLSGVILDVTERREADARRRQLLQEQAARAEADKASRAKDEFLATLAHELRNPLAPILNGLALMKTAKEPNERVREMMERQARQLVRLVDDLLEISRLTHGKLVLQRERVSVRNVLDHAAEAARPTIEARGHVLVLEPGTESLIVDADAVRLGQVVGNLLDNAAKYTPEGGRIELRAWREEGVAVIRVADNGAGIEADLLPHVFELFTQARHDDARGLGIGLSLVRRLVQMHGGTVSASSAGAGRGSAFELRLPLLAAGLAETASLAPASAESGTMQRVLIVDDNRDAADSLGALLGMLGGEVRIEYDGHAAIAAIESWRPEVVLLDLGMPGMDGHEVARRMRAEPRYAALTLVALTGWGQQQDRERTSAAGFDHHLVKPVDIGELRALLAAPHAQKAQRNPAAKGP